MANSGAIDGLPLGQFVNHDPAEQIASWSISTYILHDDRGDDHKDGRNNHRFSFGPHPGVALIPWRGHRAWGIQKDLHTTQQVLD
jgi:hypothetical protein